MCGWNGYFSLAVSDAHVSAEWLHHPYRLGGPCVGTMATSHLPFRGPICWRNGYITLSIPCL